MNPMRTYDVKRERKDLYAPKQHDFSFVDVPDQSFLMVDGHGDPNSAPTYRAAVEALYSVSYAARAVARTRLGRVHTVAPLEGLWSATNLEVFATREKGAWDWTMMIAQPNWITTEMVEEARAVAQKKRLPALGLVRFEQLAEGPSVQILHVGSHDDEGPTLARPHDEFLPAQGLVPTGRHHEIYLSDPRKTEAGRLKTILRQPVTAAT